MSTNVCPYCGHEIQVTLSRTIERHGGLRSLTNWLGHYGLGMEMEREPSFDGVRSETTPLPPHVVGIAAGAMTQQQWREVSFESPAREPNIDADVAVPALQAAVTGLAVGFIGAGLCWGFMSQDWQHITAVGAAVGLGVFTYTWWQLLTDQRSLLRTVERYVGHDLDGDGIIGQPQPVRLEVYHDNGAGTGDASFAMFAHLPIDDAKFTTLVRAALDGQSLTLARWTGSGGQLSRAEFEQTMAELERAGIIGWVDDANHAQGRTVTRPGRAALEAWLNRTHARARTQSTPFACDTDDTE